MFVGQSPEALRIRKWIREVAKTDDPVIILGEAGTGKEFIAHEIHKRSRQKNKPFITLNCSAIGETILDADLFGEQSDGLKGVERKIGIFEQVKKDIIIYLENLQDLSDKYQTIIFNILTEKKFKQPGTGKIIEIQARFLSASTDKNIFNKNGFRKDLLNCLSRFKIETPTLKNRKQDIPLLFTQFLENYSKEFDTEIPAIPTELFESLIESDWPGNVRELKNAARNLLLMSPEGTLSTEYLPFEIKKHPFATLIGKELSDALQEVERYLIKKALERFSGNQTKAARSLSVSEAALRYKMKKYGLSKKSF